MIDHIYGKINLISDSSRPNFFIKELSINIDYFINKFEESIKPFSANTESFLKTYSTNLFEGIRYYKKLIPDILEETDKIKQIMRDELEALEYKLLSYTYKFV